MSERTLQDIFEQVAMHLLTQNRRSFLDGESGMCAYKSPDGLMCAIGPLIIRGRYGTYGEGRPVAYLFAKGHLPKIIGHGDRELEIFKELQAIHDMSLPTEWKSKLQEFAAGYDLNAEMLKDFD